MKKHHNRYLRKLISTVLALALVFTYTVAIYAEDEVSGDENFETVEEPAATQEPDTVPDEHSTHVTEENQDQVSEDLSEGSDNAQTVSVSGEAAEPEPPVDEGSDSAQTAQTDNTDGAEAALEPSADQGLKTAQASNVSRNAAVLTESSGGTAAAGSAESSDVKSTQTAMIRIGDISFNAEDVETEEEEAAHWSEGKGWKNVAGQYVALVDYKGGEEIYADEGIVTLAVAGVNKIGALKGNCSYQIVGSGIVLIDSIELEDGNGITLHPNTSLYESGSAAVFLKQQEDESYLLINGKTTGILDEDYTLENVTLTIPKGASLLLNAMGIRAEYWVPEGEQQAVADVTIYKDTVPKGVYNKNHENSWVSYTDYVSRLTIGKNSALNVENGATVELLSYTNEADYYPSGIIEAELVVEGVLNIAGVVEGGCINIQDGGYVTGSGIVKTSDVQLQPDGNISNGVTIKDSSLDIYGKAEGSKTVSLKVDSTKMYLHGPNIDIAELNAAGSSMMSIDTEGFLKYTYSRLGNVTFSGSDGNLDIVANNHEYSLDGNDWSGSFPYRLLEDCSTEIYGKICNGTVSVLAGGVKYTGDKVSFLPSTQQSVLPVAPEGYASRVFVSGLVNMESNLDPLNISLPEASARAALDEIPVYTCLVYDKLVGIDSGNILPSREWVVDGSGPFLDVNSKPVTLSRAKYKDTNIPELLRDIGATDEDGDPFSNFYLAVEVINADGSRTISFYDEDYALYLKDAILVRIVSCHWWGGSGGGSATHVQTAFTGTGVLGGPGAGSVRTGTAGAVIYSVGNYTPPQPEPTDPDPNVDDNDSNNDPVPDKENDNKDYNNSNNSSKNNSSDNGNTADDTTDTNGADTANDNTNRNAPRRNTATAAAAEGLVVSISLIEPATNDTIEEILKVVKEIPQIWELTVTDAGAPVTELAGTPVNVSLPFTVPEAWGDPAEIAESDDLYAVFADEEGELTAYRAHYEPETEVVSFDAEQTGEFVIVKFEYGFTDEELANEEEGFSEEFYKGLAELEEVRYLLAVLEAEKEAAE